MHQTLTCVTNKGMTNGGGIPRESGSEIITPLNWTLNSQILPSQDNNMHLVQCDVSPPPPPPPPSGVTESLFLGAKPSSGSQEDGIVMFFPITFIVHNEKSNGGTNGVIRGSLAPAQAPIVTPLPPPPHTHTHTLRATLAIVSEFRVALTGNWGSVTLIYGDRVGATIP